MARMFPDSQKSRIVFVSRAEEITYEACRKLPESWRVYYSCTLSQLEDDRGLQSNEIDFVLYHPKWGLFVVEVKGGRIKYDSDDGRFFSINRSGRAFAIKNPFHQSLVWKSRFLRYLKRENVKVPATHIVCFPTVHEADIVQTAEVEPKLVVGRNRLEELASFLQQLAIDVHPEKYLNFSDVSEQLDKILRGQTYATSFHFRDYLDFHENKVRNIEAIHETLVTPVASSKRLGIEGEAGTGKTLLAMHLAKHFIEQGKNVLFLSTNPVLNHHIATELPRKAHVKTYAELANSFGIELLRRPKDFEGTREDWIQYVGPERLKEAVGQSKTRYDVLLCDEAQDVQPFWWESIETVLAGEDSHFYIFFDRSQGVFGSGSSESTFVAEDVLPLPSPYFPLVSNYRTTKEISEFSRSFRTGTKVLPSHSSRKGYPPEIVSYESAEDARSKLEYLLKTVVEKESVLPEELTILSARRPFHDGSVLKDSAKLGQFKLLDLGGIKGTDWQKTVVGSNKIPISTIAGFKGLETEIGIILNLDEYNLPITNPIMVSLFYVACTRARHMLYLFVRKGSEKEAALKKALSQVETQGQMVIDKSILGQQLTGKVLSYSDDRFGWLAVDGEGFDNGRILFLAFDVKQSRLDKIEVGMQLKFTPQIENETLIAADLKKM